MEVVFADVVVVEMELLVASVVTAGKNLVALVASLVAGWGWVAASGSSVLCLAWVHTGMAG